MRLIFLISILTFCIGKLFSQTVCDSVDIVSIQHPLFTDTFVYVVVENNSSELFSYPGFILFDQGGDTVAVEMVNYFGIGQNQLHRLSPVTSDLMNEYPQARLELWRGFYDTLICTYTQDVALCPGDSCSEVYISVGNFGGALAFASYAWEVKDADMNIVASGSLVLDTIQQGDADTICLTPGESYHLSMMVSNPTGGQVYLGIGGPPDVFSGIQEPIDFNGNEIDFEVLKNCANVVESISSLINQMPIEIVQLNKIIQVSRLDGKPLGELLVYDSIGKELIRIRTSKLTKDIDLSGMPAGAYVISNNYKGELYSKKVVLR